MTPDNRVVVWFDIDNTLYSASSKISHAMGERIHSQHLAGVAVCANNLTSSAQITSLSWGSHTKRLMNFISNIIPSMALLSAV